MRSVRARLSLVVVMVVCWVIFFGRLSISIPDEAILGGRDGKDQGGADRARGLQLPHSPGPVSALALVGAGGAESLATHSSPLSPADEPFKFQKDLSRYAAMSSKVFMSEEEKRTRQSLLTNADLLRSLGSRIQVATANPRIIGEQSVAVDLLLEALQLGDAQVAAEVLTEVIRDPLVEDARLDQGARANLAGLKGEILYKWSAMVPELTAEFEALLPGPVTRKIWQNVQEIQNQNVAASEVEARNH
ncbi:MAG: hypothetical protein AB7G93_12995 [Bdellovibrionales bacterium]